MDKYLIEDERYQKILGEIDAEFSKNYGMKDGVGITATMEALLVMAEAHKRGENMVTARLGHDRGGMGAFRVSEYVDRVQLLLADRKIA